MRPITMLSAQYKIENKSGEHIEYNLCKGGYFSNVEEYGLKIIGKTQQKAEPIPENPQEVECVKVNSKYVCCGKNIFGGYTLAETVENITGSVRNTENKTITYNSSAMANSPVVFSGFDENTRYTFIFDYYTEYNGIISPHSNLAVVYTDGTVKPINTKVIVSDVGRSVKSIIGSWYTGTTTLYYEKCGVFKGIISEELFEKYIGNEIIQPCNLNTDDIWYPTLGIIKRNSLEKTFDGTEDWQIYDENLSGVFKLLIANGHCLYYTSKCSHFKKINTANLGSQNGYLDQYTAWFIFSFPTLKTVNEFKIWLAQQYAVGTPLKLTSVVKEPYFEYVSSQSIYSPIGYSQLFQIPTDLKSDMSATMLVRK